MYSIKIDVCFYKTPFKKLIEASYKLVATEKVNRELKKS